MMIRTTVPQPFDATAPPAKPPYRVLVVGESNGNDDYVGRSLREGGFEVLESTNCDNAVDLASRAALDVIVVDRWPSDRDGLELCRRLDIITPRLPVLQLWPAAISAAVRVEAFQSGIEDHLIYPIDAGVLCVTVAALGRLRRSTDVAARAARAHSDTLLQETLDALTDRVALLDRTGALLVVNRAWFDLPTVAGAFNGGADVGANYASVCEHAADEGAVEFQSAALGIRGILANQLDTFVVEYSSHSSPVERCYRMTVQRTTRSDAVAAVVTHADRTVESEAVREIASERGKAEAAHVAREAEGALFRGLTEQSTEFVTILAENGRFRYVSPSVTRTLGYLPDEILGSYPVELVHDEDRSTMVDAFDRLATGGPGMVVEMLVRLRHKNGSYRYFEGAGQNLLHDPAVRGITTNSRDVTPRIEAEQARRALEHRFRSFVETAPDLIWEVDRLGQTTYINPGVESLLGYSVDDIAMRPIFAFMSEDSATIARAAFADGGSPIELEFVRANGERVRTLVRIARTIDEAGDFCGGLARVATLGSTKAADQQMAAALSSADIDRRRLEATLRALPVGVWIADVDGQLTHSNPAAASIWGGQAPHTAIREYSVYRAWWPNGGLPLEPGDWALTRTLRDGEIITGEMIEIERFDGTRGHILNSAAPILNSDNAVIGGVVVNVDITDRQLATLEREQLLESLQVERARLASVFEHAPSFLAVLRGPGHVFERINPALQALVGYRDLIGQPLLVALPEIGDQGVVDVLDRVQESGNPFVGRQIPVCLQRVQNAPPETRYIDMVFQRLADPDGESRIAMHGVDVTEQVVVANALRATEERLRDQFAKLPVPTFLWSMRANDFELVTCNDAAIKLSAMAKSGVMMTELFRGWGDIATSALESLRNDAVVQFSVMEAAMSGGEVRTYDLTIGPQQPDRVLVHAVNTTEQTHLETQLRKSQKMDAVGQLAGGIAHDFNNLLTVIGAQSDFLLQDLPKADPKHADVRAIKEAGMRAATLTRQLLAFSRKQILRPTVIDLNETVANIDRMLTRLVGDDVEIVLALAPTVGHLLLDVGQVEQVLMNLVLNARDAMPRGGRVVISTGELDLLTETASARGSVPRGKYATLTVADAGTGMTAETQARLFEPFFTTKEVGKGTGLGLATVYGIIKQSGGHISVESRIGEGSTFEIYFPITEDAVNDALEVRSTQPPVNVVETILIVEDDALIRKISKRILTAKGYSVIEASNGLEAVALCGSHRGVIHAIITDVIMPGMNGAEVINYFRIARPDCKRLMVSGYTDDEITRRGISSADVVFVQKPFTAEELTRQLRSALDSK